MGLLSDSLETGNLTSSYSSMLNRIAIFDFGYSLLLMLIFRHYSTEFKSITDQSSIQIEIFGIKTLPIAGVFVALLIAIISRITYLHDLISSMLGIRSRFDINHILIPMARECGISIDDHMRKRCKLKRNDLMRRVFYKYASYNNPQIDRHLIDTALDGWSWLWVALELSLISMVGLIVSHRYGLVGAFYVILIFLFCKIIFIFISFKYKCVSAAETEIAAILEDQTRRQTIIGVFSECDTTSGE